MRESNRQMASISDNTASLISSSGDLGVKSMKICHDAASLCSATPQSHIFSKKFAARCLRSKRHHPASASPITMDFTACLALRHQSRSNNTSNIKTMTAGDLTCLRPFSILHSISPALLFKLLIQDDYLMSSSANTNTLLSMVRESGMEDPPATLRELVEQSEPEPYIPADPFAIPTEKWGDPGFGEKCISKATMRKLAREAATFPETRTAFITPAANPSNGPKTLSEELDWHIFNRRLLIRLYDADYPDPEACPELKQVKWKTERYYACFANTEDLQKLSHIRVLEEFLAGSVARREARKAVDTARTAGLKALKTEQQRRFDAIRATWPEPKFRSLDEYMNEQHELSERIWNGTVDIQQLEQVVSLRLLTDAS
jgi:hypothetical protein